MSIGDMADVLSLKDNKYHVEDYTTALHLLARAEVSCGVMLRLEFSDDCME